MSHTNILQECPELSRELKKLLAKAGLDTFSELAKLSRLDLISRVPKIKVRLLSTLNHALRVRELDFAPDNSIKLDTFIDQRKLVNLWEQNILTYQQLNQMDLLEFILAMGGPQSRFARKKKESEHWMTEHGLVFKKQSLILPHLSGETASLLFKEGIKNLEDLVHISDSKLRGILRGGSDTKTRHRVIEVKYALIKAGLSKTHRLGPL